VERWKSTSLGKAKRRAIIHTSTKTKYWRALILSVHSSLHERDTKRCVRSTSSPTAVPAPDLCEPATHARVSRHYVSIPDEGEYCTDLAAIATDRLARGI
jgi:hypothetical protein